MTEHVEPVDLGVTWSPGAPEAVLLSRDLGPTVLALRAHHDDPDKRCVVFVCTGCRFASMTPPNDEAVSGHRLWEKGLSEALWAGIVQDSELVESMERQNRVHPFHNANFFGGLTHYVLPLKECVVEVVADDLAVHRLEDTTVEAAVRAGH